MIFRSLFLELLWKPIFLKWMENSLKQEGGYDRPNAISMAKYALAEHLEDNSIRFGDQSFSWRKKDAVEICYEYVMRYA